VQIIKEVRVGKSISKGKDGRKRLYGRVSLTVPGWLVGKKVIVAVWTMPTMEEIKYGSKGVKLEEEGREEVKEERKEAKPAVRKGEAIPADAREILRQSIPGLPVNLTPAEARRLLRDLRNVEAQAARGRLPPITADEDEEDEEWVLEDDEEEV
jgi:hypothetical protein